MVSDLDKLILSTVKFLLAIRIFLVTIGNA